MQLPSSNKLFPITGPFCWKLNGFSFSIASSVAHGTGISLP